MGFIVTGIGALLGAFFQVLVNFFIKYFSKRVALGAAAVVIFLGFTAAFIAALQAIITSIAVAMPASLVIAMSWFIPANAMPCLAAYFAALTARFVYDLKTKVIQYSLF
jgi:hypothetical protein